MKSVAAREVLGRPVEWHDLRGEYTWKPYSKIQVRGLDVIDDGGFELDDGHALVGFINAFMRKHGLVRVQAVHKIESLIQSAPKDKVMTRLALCRWLESKW